MARSNEVKNIHQKPLKDKYKVGNDELVIKIEDALYGEINEVEELLDKELVENFLSAIVSTVKKHTTKYNLVPKFITISHSTAETEAKDITSDKTIFQLQTPFWNLDDVCIDHNSKNQTLTALTIIQNSDKIYKEWGLQKVFKNNRSVVLNFYGPSGTGKTMMAEAVANYLGKEMFAVNYSELESKYVGETPKNISEIFRQAEKSGAVIVFDEADSFLGKRLTNVSQSADYGVNVTRSVMLMEIEKYSGVIIFTTNLIENYDEAFKRRILANIEFGLPDVEARKQLWRTHIPNELPVASNVTPDALAERYGDISGADIKDMVLFATVACIRHSDTRITLAHFDSAYEYINKRNHYNTGDYGNVEVKCYRNQSR